MSSFPTFDYELIATIQKLSQYSEQVQRCVLEGCYGLPAGLEPQCYDPANIKTYNPVVYNSFGMQFACTGQQVAAELESQQTAARTATQTQLADAQAAFLSIQRELVQTCPVGIKHRDLIYNKDTGFPGAALAGVVIDAGTEALGCYVFQRRAFEQQKAFAAYLKTQRRLVPNLGYAESVRWAMQAASCASMAVVALNVYPNAAWYKLHPDWADMRWRGDSPAFPVMDPLLPGAHVQSYELTLANELFMLPTWAATQGDASDVMLPSTQYTDSLLASIINNRGSRQSLRNDYEERAVALINFRNDLRNQMMDYAERWLDWVLSLGSYAEVLTPYVEEWVKSATTYGPSNPYGSVPPVSAQDYKAILDGVKEMNVDMATSAMSGVAGVAIGIGTLNPAAIISSLIGVFGSLFSAGPRLSEVARVIQPGFARWLSDPNLDLNVAGPETSVMMQRVIASLGRYQRLGVPLGLRLDAGQELPRSTAADLPLMPQQKKKNKLLVPILLGGGAVAAALIIRRFL